MAAAPKANASRQKWVEFFADEYPEVDTDDMNREDMRDVHKLLKAEGVSPVTAADATNGYVAPPSIDDVPEDLRFTTDTGEDRDVERTPFALDGFAFWLERPSDAAITLYLPQIMSDDARVRSNAMAAFVQQVVDVPGMMYLQERITDKANNFEPGTYGRIIAAVMDKWGDDTARAAVAKANDAELQNRKQRRAAARAAGKK